MVGVAVATNTLPCICARTMPRHRCVPWNVPSQVSMHLQCTFNAPSHSGSAFYCAASSVAEFIRNVYMLVCTYPMGGLTKWPPQRVDLEPSQKKLCRVQNVVLQDTVHLNNKTATPFGRVEIDTVAKTPLTVRCTPPGHQIAQHQQCCIITGHGARREHASG